MRWAGYVARMGEGRKLQGFDGKVRREDTTWKTKMMGSEWILGRLAEEV
jgi:hypothetical protein